MNKVLSQSRWLQWFVVILIVLAIVWLVDIKQTWVLLQSTDLRWMVVAFLVVQIQVVLSATRWWLTANRLGQKLNWQRALSEYYIATLANLSLPGGVTGDAARIYRSRESKGWQTAIMSVTLERLSGQLVLFVVTLIGWFSWPFLFAQEAPANLRQVLWIFFILCIVLACTVVFLSRLSTRVRSFVSEFSPAVKRVWVDDNQWIFQLVLSLAIIATYVGVFTISAKSISEPIPTVALVTIVPVVLLSMVIPLSIGGWGIRELAAASLWPVMGLAAEAGIASSIVYGLISMLSVVPGVCICLLAKQGVQADSSNSFDDRL